MNKLKAQVIEGIVSVVVNAVLFAIKFWAGMVTGSIALIADAWHTLSDSLTSILVVFTAKLSSKKPDKKHPFGHGRWEQISSIFMAFVLALIGYEFFTKSIDRFSNRESVVYGTLAIVVTIISIIIKELMAQYAFYLGRKTDNVIVKADGWHHRSDSFSSVVVLIGIVVTKFVDGIWWMDSVLGIFCSLVLFYATFEIMKEAISKLLGEEPDQELLDNITGEIKKIFNDEFKIHHFRLHNYNTYRALTFHIMLDENKSIKDGHTVATVIENMVKEKFDIIATIHVEPLE